MASRKTTTDRNDTNTLPSTILSPDATLESPSQSIAQHGSQFAGNCKVSGNGNVHQGNNINNNNNTINHHHTTDQCLADLRITDPRHDKQRIQEVKGGLIQDSYIWVLENSDFCQWLGNENSHLLWVKGDPGKGKTMLLCGIIDHLKKSQAEGKVLSYFFCQATDERINTATSVARGLIFMLCSQDASLMSHLKNHYDPAGKALFEDANAWHALSEIFTDILQDPTLQGVCLVVDALDECVKGLPQLLDLIIQTSRLPHTKWLVSSRNWTDIEEKLCDVAHRLSLELNAKSVSAAVESYIQFKVSELTRIKGYQQGIANEVRQYLSSHADDTFLWVALVCHELGNSKVRSRHTHDVLKSFPPGLDPLYQRMVEYNTVSRDAQACREILALPSTVYRPVSVDELQGLTQSVKEIENLSQEEVLEVIAACGSFLTLRDSIIFFVHQSAKDFLLKKASNTILSSSIENQQFKIFADSLDLLSNTLKQDIYDLRAPGYPIDQVKIPYPDPLASSRYSCAYWVDHLQDAGLVHARSVLTSVPRFLKTKYLYWLEALSLMHNVPEGVKAIQKLERMMANNDSEELKDLSKDARRFLLAQKRGFELAPLQVYSSALIFSPTNSLIRRCFSHKIPAWVKLAPKAGTEWSACLQTIEGHRNRSITAVSFSVDGRQIASNSSDMTVKLWDATSGNCLRILKGEGAWLIEVLSFSPDGKRIVLGSTSGIEIRDTDSGNIVKKLDCLVRTVAYSLDGQKIASGGDSIVQIWNAHSLELLHASDTGGGSISSISFSASCLRFGLESWNPNTTTIFHLKDTTSELATLFKINGKATSMAFSSDGGKAVLGFDSGALEVWDTTLGQCVQHLKADQCYISSVAFSPDCLQVVSGSSRSVQVWDIATGQRARSYKTSDHVNVVTFSPDGGRVVAGSDTFQIWDNFLHDYESLHEGHEKEVIKLDLSPDLSQIASSSDDGTVKIWDSASGDCVRTFIGHDGQTGCIFFSPDGKKIASGSSDNTIRIWDITSNNCIVAIPTGHADGPPLPRRKDNMYSITFSDDGQHVKSEFTARGFYRGDLLLWLPKEFRPVDDFSGFKAAGSMVAIGTSLGRVLIMRFALDGDEALPLLKDWRTGAAVGGISTQMRASIMKYDGNADTFESTSSLLDRSLGVTMPKVLASSANFMDFHEEGNFYE
ncbi:hypothetical protein PFICI_11057 [Pestalotiopsis fici W106-1]|uniref:NACHT domain-containing protein n=1 Tax=Pestalotiopsis fici (strain W106-1 / CGMCC3.15140) TaxID=1229662 RepID=W3WTJ8_PESFW|nr:uncharacterized protein PFICI_11057 [Pestalotiopsis fici W106-1]ETS77183.1 hypothetical protein PFICI_11057 [Pestalotiopsis fici W106-1]